MDTERLRGRSAPPADAELRRSLDSELRRFLDHEKDLGVGVAPTHPKGGPFAMIHAP
jgi:hypothetical protein